jgi:hypothetical protein
MELKKSFDSFSRRKRKANAVKDTFSYEITPTLRTKVFLLCERRFPQRGGYQGGGDLFGLFWMQIHKILQMRHGRQTLSQGVHSVVDVPEPRFSALDSTTYLNKCSSDEFLDFVEDIFKVEITQQIARDVNTIVGAINEILLSEGTGYELTKWIWSIVKTERRVSATIVAMPQIIRKDNQVLHEEAIMPALELLSDPRFEQANKEFLEALEDYKKNDLDDCLTKCCTAFESVMKVICVNTHLKGYKETDAAGALIQTVLSNSTLPDFFNTPLTIIATIRNKLSKSHGAGTQPKHVERHVARYAINATASAILLLIEESKL